MIYTQIQLNKILFSKLENKYQNSNNSNIVTLLKKMTEEDAIGIGIRYWLDNEKIDAEIFYDEDLLNDINTLISSIDNLLNDNNYINNNLSKNSNLYKKPFSSNTNTFVYKKCI